MNTLAKFNLKPIKKSATTKERVYSEIKNVILNGQLSQDVIFTEVQLAESLNTSRTPVREALQELLKEGLIVSMPRKGMSIRKVTENEVEQIFLVRSHIESEVMKKLAREMTSSQVDALKQIIKEQEVAMVTEDAIQFINLDQKFHLTLVKFAGYELIEQILLNLHNLSQLIGLKAIKKQNRRIEVLKEHLTIIEYLEKKQEKEAILSMTEHLELTRKSLQGH